MSSVSGIIQEIRANQRTVQGQQKTAYDIVVAGQKYGAGFFAPKASEGDFVTFDVEERNGFKQVAPRSLKVGKAPSLEVAAAAAKAAAGPTDKKQDTIARQAASNTAIAFLQLLASQDALPVPASKSKGDKQVAIEALLHGYEQSFYENNTGQKWEDISPVKKEKTVASPEVQSEGEADSPWE